MSPLSVPVRAEPVEALPFSADKAGQPFDKLRASEERTSPEQQKLRAVAEQFEAVMLRQMIGSMRSASLGDGLFDSSATEQFREMGDAKMAETMAHQSALHIADLLVKQFGARLAPAAALESPAK